MISFIIALLLLIVGYFTYGKFAEKVFKTDYNRKTPAIANPDGVDYIPMPWWKLFLIQFLNIAGTGPIFGAVMGIMFGPAAFLWIVFGCIFGGAVHDFISAMISIRQNGASLTEIVGTQLGKAVKTLMLLFTIVLLVMVGAVFVSQPAALLHGLVPKVSVTVFAVIVFCYYILATLLPVDKIIGKIYPVFGFIFIFMALGLLFSIFRTNAPIPEIWGNLKDMHPKGLPIFPMMFVSIACGAISGFHATQSPLMARCITNERYGRRIFYGAMITEGIVALIWAASASSFFAGMFPDCANGIEALQKYSAQGHETAEIVAAICKGWLGTVGGILAIIGVVVAPITSGDTALRSGRLIIADFLHFDQKPLLKRLAIAVPMFAVTFLVMNLKSDVLWRYFAWSNQTLSIFTLWACTVYLYKNNHNHGGRSFHFFITIIPAMFMTAVCFTYILSAPEGFHLNYTLSVACGVAMAVIFLTLFIFWTRKYKNSIQKQN
ncbi:MAG: carbon starvation protein A [Bacteroidales bacterium]|nr:carbon starvation protein A [Bacteroidales bacterium]